MKNTSTTHRRKKLLTHDNVFDFFVKFIICFAVFIILYPIMFTFFASISSGWAVDTGRVIFFPVNPTLESYRMVVTEQQFWRSYLNSIFITSTQTILTMFVLLLAAFAFTKKEMPGFRIFTILMLITFFFSAGQVPQFMNLGELGLRNMTGLILMGSGTGMVSILIVKSAYQGIPDGLLEASIIDGCNDFQTLWYIAIPSIKPTIAVLAFNQGVGSWNAWIWASILLREERLMPLQLYLRNFIIRNQAMLDDMEAFINPEFSAQTLIYALIFAAMLPIIIVFPYMQRYFKRGIFEGGIKA